MSSSVVERQPSRSRSLALARTVNSSRARIAPKKKPGASTYAFVTVTDYAFFPGTVATVNSVIHFHPKADIFVVNNQNRPLSAAQSEILSRHKQVRLVDSQRLAKKGRYIEAFELKAYACCDLCDGYEVIILIDSDCLLCSRIDPEIQRCLQSAGFLGGDDGNGIDYDLSYTVYGIRAPCRNPKYMSTSLMICAVNHENKQLLQRWTECCSAAEFNGRGPYPGHSDQGVLNAVLFASGQSHKIELLHNHLWSQHWEYWSSIIDFKQGVFINRSADDQHQRTFHSGGTEKCWLLPHRQHVLNTHPHQTFPYAWFLAMLWFGPCRNWSADPLDYLPPESHHLLGDLVDFFPQISQVYPPATSIWNELTDILIQRIGRRPSLTHTRSTHLVIR